MKKRSIALAICVAAGLLAGCAGRAGGGNGFDPGYSSIYVSREGKFQTATVENYEEKDYYNEDELKTYLETMTTAFNGGHGEGAVTLKSCSLNKGTARMIFDYSSADSLVRFVQEYEDKENIVDSISLIAPADAAANAAAEGVSLVNPSDGKAVTAEEIGKNAGQAVVVEGPSPVTIQAEGKILYVSGGVTLRDSYTAKTTEGRNYIIIK